jgi:hypothetical protein
MKLIAQFDFDKTPSTNGAQVQSGDDEAFTLNGIPRPYTCDKNELLVVNKFKVLGDKLGMLSNIEIVVDGYPTTVVEPGECVSVRLQIKRASEMHIPVRVIDYPITVELDVTQYKVTPV